MSGDSTAPMKQSTMNPQRGDTELWESNTEVDAVTNDRRPTNNSDDGDVVAAADGHVDVGVDAGQEEDVNIHAFDDANGEIFSHLEDVPDYQDKLKVIHDRITRIVDRMSSLTKNLKQVHQGLKNYTTDSSKSNAVQGTVVKKAAGGVGSTQTDPLIKPELNMLAERVGDSVACQTIEDNPFKC